MLSSSTLSMVRTTGSIPLDRSFPNQAGGGSGIEIVYLHLVVLVVWILAG